MRERSKLTYRVKLSVKFIERQVCKSIRQQMARTDLRDAVIATLKGDKEYISKISDILETIVPDLHISLDDRLTACVFQTIVDYLKEIFPSMPKNEGETLLRRLAKNLVSLGFRDSIVGPLFDALFRNGPSQIRTIDREIGVCFVIYRPFPRLSSRTAVYHFIESIIDRYTSYHKRVPIEYERNRSIEVICCSAFKDKWGCFPGCLTYSRFDRECFEAIASQTMSMIDTKDITTDKVSTRDIIVALTRDSILMNNMGNILCEIEDEIRPYLRTYEELHHEDYPYYNEGTDSLLNVIYEVTRKQPRCTVEDVAYFLFKQNEYCNGGAHDGPRNEGKIGLGKSASKVKQLLLALMSLELFSPLSIPVIEKDMLPYLFFSLYDE
jgi:hypothetical protein